MAKEESQSKTPWLINVLPKRAPPSISSCAPFANSPIIISFMFMAVIVCAPRAIRQAALPCYYSCRLHAPPRVCDRQAEGNEEDLRRRRGSGIEVLGGGEKW